MQGTTLTAVACLSLLTCLVTSLHPIILPLLLPICSAASQIPFEDLEVQDQIGGGGFSLVYRGLWKVRGEGGAHLCAAQSLTPLTSPIPTIHILPRPHTAVLLPTTTHPGHAPGSGLMYSSCTVYVLQGTPVAIKKWFDPTMSDELMQEFRWVEPHHLMQEFRQEGGAWNCMSEDGAKGQVRRREGNGH